MTTPFDYDDAFSRNIGWTTKSEQAELRKKRVAIAGLGGVGGGHLLAHTRLGIGAFHIADFDEFGLHNFNRQAGATMASLDQKKCQTLHDMALNINPELDIKTWPKGIFEDDIDAFLDGVDLYVDGLDFFALPVRRQVFAACAEKGIPAVTAAPLGMGTGLLVFLPGKMTFEEYFRLEGKDIDEQQIRFLIGLAPALLQRGYIVDPTTVNLTEKRGPSTIMACEMCAGTAATQSLKILLKRGKVHAAPVGMQFDAYRNKLVKTWRPGGNNNPIQRFMLWFAMRELEKMKRAEQG